MPANENTSPVEGIKATVENLVTHLLALEDGYDDIIQLRKWDGDAGEYRRGMKICRLPLLQKLATSHADLQAKVAKLEAEVRAANKGAQTNARVNQLLVAEKRKMQNTLESISGCTKIEYAIKRANDCLFEIGVKGYEKED